MLIRMDIIENTKDLSYKIPNTSTFNELFAKVKDHFNYDIMNRLIDRLSSTIFTTIP